MGWNLYFSANWEAWFTQRIRSLRNVNMKMFPFVTADELWLLFAIISVWYTISPIFQLKFDKLSSEHPPFDSHFTFRSIAKNANNHLRLWLRHISDSSLSFGFNFRFNAHTNLWKISEQRVNHWGHRREMSKTEQKKNKWKRWWLKEKKKKEETTTEEPNE